MMIVVADGTTVVFACDGLDLNRLGQIDDSIFSNVEHNYYLKPHVLYDRINPFSAPIP